MRRMRNLAVLLAILGAPGAEAAESRAASWGLAGEQASRFEAQVVDVLCTLGGDCPAKCGDGRRQLGLLRADGVLVLAAKNAEPVFSGAAADLLPYCGQTVDVDGLMVGVGPTRVYQVQFIRRLDEAEPREAANWTKAWEARYPSLRAKEGEWFRKDPRVRGEIQRRGYLGLGQQVDKAYLKGAN